jgi:hypothetical protein
LDRNQGRIPSLLDHLNCGSDLGVEGHHVGNQQSIEAGFKLLVPLPQPISGKSKPLMVLQVDPNGKRWFRYSSSSAIAC